MTPILCFSAYNIELPTFQDILELVFYEIVKHEGYSIVKLLIKMDNMTNTKVKSNMNKQNEKNWKVKEKMKTITNFNALVKTWIYASPGEEVNGEVKNS